MLKLSSLPAETLFDSTMIACPAVCSTQLYISITALGIVLLLLAFGLLFFKKMLSKKVWIPLFIILLLAGLLSATSVRSNGCGSGCAEDAVYFDGFKLIPEGNFLFGF